MILVSELDRVSDEIRETVEAYHIMEEKYTMMLKFIKDQAKPVDTIYCYHTDQAVRFLAIIGEGESV